MSDPIKIKLGPRGAYAMGLSGGLRAAESILEEDDDKLKALPGYQLALAKVKAAAASERAGIVSRNLATLARNGVDVSRHRAVGYDPNTSELVCEFYEPDLFDTDGD